MTADILTAAGRYFDFEEPHACEIGIEEIALIRSDTVLISQCDQEAWEAARRAARREGS